MTQPENLERRADQIRADMDRTLDALERKLAPSQLLDKSLAYLRDHAGDVAHSVSDTVRRNPVPIALAVAGVGWLIASALRPREVPYADANVRPNRFRRAGATVVSTVDERPLLFGGLAVAIGALIGVLIPSTEYEDRIVGEVRDRAVERARQMGERQYQNLRSRLETQHDVEVSGQAH